MAKGKYHDWLEPDGLILLEGWAREGLSEEQIAHNMGCAVSTLKDWKNKFPAISEALKKGKAVVDFEVENALYKSAMSGNVTAMIFWLKNRRPDLWRDRPEAKKEDAGETGVIEIGRQADEPQPPEELVAQMMAEAVADE